MGSDLVRLGVDIGQQRDPSTVVVAEVVSPRPLELAVRFAERLPLGSPYPEVAARVAEVAKAAQRKGAYEVTYGCGHKKLWPSFTEVFVDATGVGRPVVELVREALGDAEYIRVRPCVFTHGDACTRQDDYSWRVGKAWLVSQLQVLLQTKRLHLPKTPETEQMAEELLNYEIRVDPDGNDRYGAFRVGTHDDLVTALGLCTLPTLVGGVTGAKPTHGMDSRLCSRCAFL